MAFLTKISCYHHKLHCLAKHYEKLCRALHIILILRTHLGETWTDAVCDAVSESMQPDQQNN